MLRRRLAIAAVNLLVFVVFAELAALAVYFVRHGGVFYLDRRIYEPLPDTRGRTLTADRLHPYFGPTHAPGHPFQRGPSKTNNFGFVSAHDYPFARTSEDQFVVGIFGGSVGVWFCELGAARLVEDLARDPLFRTKSIVPLCFSHEGYKQPQQLLVLSYFLSIGQPLDLVINIDGFNEVALASLNDRSGTDISMPSRTHLDPLINLVDQATLTPAKLYSLAAIGRYKERLNALAERLNRTRLASIGFVLEQYYEVTSRRYRAELVTFANLPSNPAADSVIHVTPPVRPREGPRLFEDIASQWVRSSVLMHELLAARGIPYFHVLQPNQYHTRRPFSADEARVALSDESPFRASVETGYPLLVSESAAGALKARQVRFLDATRIFDGERAPVYMDNCCHYTPLGNRILADFIAGAIVRASQRS